MKPSVASFLSISAIVVAGGAGLAVNATVFDASSTAAATDTSEILTVASVGAQPVASEVGLGELGSQDPVNVEAATPSTTIATNEVAVSTLSEYEIPGVGVVTISQTGSTIAVHNVSTNSGFTYTTGTPFPGRLDVRFTSTTTEIEFDAQLIDGRVVTVVKSRALNAVGTAKATSRGDHEDDDDDDDDHEESHEEHDEDDDD
ncbi:MAG: hypothetical protein RIS58_841 [Actinomycetota bacterium]